MGTKRTREDALATQTCYHLWRMGWVPYPELGGYADIVAHHPETDDVISIEAKATVNLQVVAQADKTRSWAKVNGVYVMVPAQATYTRYLRILCKELGIGIIEVGYTPMGPKARCHEFFITPCRRRNRMHTGPHDSIKPLLIPEAQYYTTPGRPSPRQFTNFRLRELTLLRILEKTPGLTYKELAQAEAEAAGKKKHASRAPTYLRELCERHAFDHFEHDDDGRVWPKYAWGSKEAGHDPLSYEGIAFNGFPDALAPLGKDDEIVTTTHGREEFQQHGY